MIDADNVREQIPGTTHFARKTSLTEVLGPINVMETLSVITTDGEVRVEPGAYYIALDARGNPYPIELSVFEETYEVVGVATP